MESASAHRSTGPRVLEQESASTHRALTEHSPSQRARSLETGECECFKGPGAQRQDVCHLAALTEHSPSLGGGSLETGICGRAHFNSSGVADHRKALPQDHEHRREHRSERKHHGEHSPMSVFTESARCAAECGSLSLSLGPRKNEADVPLLSPREAQDGSTRQNRTRSSPRRGLHSHTGHPAKRDREHWWE